MGDGEWCETCRFWRPTGEDGDGRCRRFPPVLNPPAVKEARRDGAVPRTVFDTPDLTYVWCFPATDSLGWCGEWRAKPEDQGGGA